MLLAKLLNILLKGIRMGSKIKVGFFKAVQGAFTAERIEQIKLRLVEDHDVELIEADFRDGVLINGKVYVGEVCLNECDVYFWHDTLRPSESGADNYYIHLLRALEKDVKVINTAESTEVTNDKLRAHDALVAADLPVSRYALVRSDDRIGLEKAFHELGSQVLIKPRFGGWGSGIVRCQTIEDLRSAIELAVALSGHHVHVLLEQYYENDPSQWVSVSVVAGRPILAYRKPLSLSGSDWKVYDPEKQDGRGQRSVYIKPSEELAELARRAQQAIGKDIIGFDFIATPHGYVIVDENGRPGLYDHCLQEAQIDIVDVIVDLIISKIAH